MYEIWNFFFSVSFSLFVHPTLPASFAAICYRLSEYASMGMFEQTFT